MESNVVKVLLVEDDEDDLIITRDYLNAIPNRAFALDHVADYEGAREVMAADKHDLYMIDYRLGAHSGLELLKEAVARNCPAPIILLTGMGDSAVDVAAMKAGAADYLVKGQMSADLLGRCINHALQRKQAERQLRASEERLRLSQKLESVGTLAGGIAHDFNNILTIISVFATRLREEQLSPGQTRQMLTSIDDTIKRGAALVRHLLTFSRQSEVKFESVDLIGLVRTWVGTLQETFPKTVRFALDLREDTPRIFADVTQLHQILLNLCVNARDAMQGRGLIRISATAIPGVLLRDRGLEAPAEEYACLEVADTGCGIDAETQKRIFDPFFTTKDKDQGTGLGLAIVYGIVKGHHGHIDLQSAPGQGATFRIYLPAMMGRSG